MELLLDDGGALADGCIVLVGPIDGAAIGVGGTPMLLLIGVSMATDGVAVLVVGLVAAAGTADLAPTICTSLGSLSDSSSDE